MNDGRREVPASPPAASFRGVQGHVGRKDTRFSERILRSQSMAISAVAAWKTNIDHGWTVPNASGVNTARNRRRTIMRVPDSLENFVDMNGCIEIAATAFGGCAMTSPPDGVAAPPCMCGGQ